MEAEARLIRWAGYAAVAGLVVFILSGVSFVTVGGDFPNPDDTLAVLTFFADNATLVATGMWLSVAAFALAIVAVLGLHAALKATRLQLVFGTGLAIIGLALLVIGDTLFVQGGLGLAPAYVEAEAASKSAIEAAAAAALAGGDYVGIVGSVLLGIGVVVLALASLDTGMVPKWLGRAAVAGAIAQGVGDLLLRVPGIFIVGATVRPVGLFVVYLWIAGMGIKMVRGRIPGAAGAGA